MNMAKKLIISTIYILLTIIFAIGIYNNFNLWMASSFLSTSIGILLLFVSYYHFVYGKNNYSFSFFLMLFGTIMVNILAWMREFFFGGNFDALSSEIAQFYYSIISADNTAWSVA